MSPITMAYIMGFLQLASGIQGPGLIYFKRSYFSLRGWGWGSAPRHPAVTLSFEANGQKNFGPSSREGPGSSHFTPWLGHSILYISNCGEFSKWWKPYGRPSNCLPDPYLDNGVEVKSRILFGQQRVEVIIFNICMSWPSGFVPSFTNKCCIAASYFPLPPSTSFHP